MLNIIEKINRYLIRKYLLIKGAKIPKNLQCREFFFRGIPKNLEIKGALIEKGAIISVGENAQLSIGNYFYLNSYSIIDCKYKISIGSRVMIGPHCYISDFDHDINVNLNAQHHRINKSYKEVIIEDNVWIGAGVKILKGVTIGKNSVIGAGTVVTKEIPPNVVAVGNPAKILREIKNI